MAARIGCFIAAGLLTIIVTQDAAMSGAADSTNERNQWIQRMSDWRDAIMQHAPGKSDEAAITIGSWPERDLEVIVCLVKDLTKSENLDKRLIPGDVIKTANSLKRKMPRRLLIANDPNPILKRGALLHTDIAMLQLETGMAHASDSGSGIILVNDGRGVPQAGGWNWTLARLLLDSVSPNPSQDEMVRKWYIATTAYLFAHRDWGFAVPHLASALKYYPSDPRILFYAGVLHEIYASPSGQNLQLPSGIHQTFASRESELKFAWEFLQKAVVADPEFAEGHLHLGRVMGLRGQHDRAVTELERAASAESDPQIQYYCALFLGEELARLNRRSEARSQFERAAKLYPAAQSPLLALSLLASRNGDRQSAQLSVQRLFALPVSNSIADDPWWIYDQSHVRDEPSMIAKMRKMFGEISQ